MINNICALVATHRFVKMADARISVEHQMTFSILGKAKVGFTGACRLRALLAD